jgi:hypothetical protein
LSDAVVPVLPAACNCTPPVTVVPAAEIDIGAWVVAATA